MKDNQSEIKTSDLKLGDVIRLNILGALPDTVGCGAFPDAIVNQIKDDLVHFTRPYMVTADFSYTGGVICYIGYEEFTRYVGEEKIYLVRRGDKLK